MLKLGNRKVLIHSFDLNTQPFMSMRFPKNYLKISEAWPDKPVKSVEVKLLAPSLNYQQRFYSNRNGLTSAEFLNY